MKHVNKVHPLVIFSLGWTVTFFLFFRGWLAGTHPDFSVSGILIVSLIGTMIGSAQYFLVPGNRLKKPKMNED